MRPPSSRLYLPRHLAPAISKHFSTRCGPNHHSSKKMEQRLMPVLWQWATIV